MVSYNLHLNYQQAYNWFNLKSFVLLFFLNISTNILLGQNNQDTTLTLVGDTLFTNKGLKLFVGQNISAGKGSLENGWYKTMEFKSALNFPTMFSAMADPKRETDDDTLEVTKANNLLKDNIHPNETLVIEKIIKRGSKRHGYGYVLFLQHTTKTFGDSNIACSDIIAALKTKELILIQNLIPTNPNL